MEASAYNSSTVDPYVQAPPFNSSGSARETISRLAFDSAKRYWQTVKICFMMPEKNMLDNLF
jgi:hypothetical protein